MATEFLDVRDAKSVVAVGEDPLRAWAVESLSQLEAGAALHVVPQAANLTASIFKTKYEFARERGFQVVGLEPLVTRLATLGDRLIKACIFTVDEHFGVVVFDESLTQVVGILKVKTQVGSS